MRFCIFTILTLWLSFPRLAPAQVQRQWLTHQTSDPSRIIVNWETATPGDSVVHYGFSSNYGQTVSRNEQVTLHHVEIPLTKKDVVYHYSVQTGDQRSSDAAFKGYPSDELRVAVVGDWGYAKGKVDMLLRENLHLLLTAGDNVPNLHKYCGAGVTNCTKAFSAWIDSQPELFRTTPLMPTLGNHDREIRPRGPKPPAEAVYDIEATAFRTFFELPGDEWKWYFDVPDFDVRFIALDFSHLSDLGTTWQTCHSYKKDAEQFPWYGKLMEQTTNGFVVTLYNERNSDLRSREGGAWHQLFRRGSIAITGFGYFAERAEVDGFTYYNTALSGTGDRYPDPKSALIKSEDNYMLLTLRKSTGEMTVDLKNLKGDVIDHKVYQKRVVK